MKVRVKILVKMEDIAYLCRKKEGYMSIKEYRLTSMEEPTDAMLHELMYQVACSARQSSYNAKQVLKQKMQETIELIQRQRQTLSSNSQ